MPEPRASESRVAREKVVDGEMKKAGAGKIINIGSMMSIFGASFTTPYAASKGGIVQMELHLDRFGDPEAATVEMGQATFKPQALPCTLAVDELIQQADDLAVMLEMAEEDEGFAAEAPKEIERLDRAVEEQKKVMCL